MTTAAEIRIQVSTNAGAAAREMGQLDKATDKSNKTIGQLAKSILGPLGLTVGIAAAAKGAVELTKRLIQAGSDAEETRNKFSAVFSRISNDAEAAAQSLEDNFGLSGRAAQQLLSDTGDLLTGFGFTQEAALDLSTQVNELAVDLASFTNFSGGAEGASQALTKALLGERESIKSLGIAITEADIQRLAEEKGIVGELDRQTKAALTLELAIQQSGNAIGDYERSQGSLAQAQRQANANFENLAVTLGSRLQPAATRITEIFGALAENLDDALNAADNRAVQRANELGDSFRDLIDTFDGTDESLEAIQKRFPGVSEGIIEAARETGNYAAALSEAEKAASQLQRIDFLTQTSALSDDMNAIQAAINSLDASAGGIWEDNRDAAQKFADAIRIINNEARLVQSNIQPTVEGAQQLRAAIQEGAPEETIRQILEGFIQLNPEIEAAKDLLEEIQTGDAIGAVNSGVRDGIKTWQEYRTEALTAINDAFTAIEKEGELSELLGEDFDETAAKAEVLREQIRGLLLIPPEQIDEAFTTADNTIRRLIQQLNDLAPVFEETGEDFSDLIESIYAGTAGGITTSFELVEKEAEETVEKLKATWQDYADATIDIFRSIDDFRDAQANSELQRLQEQVDATEEGTTARAAAEEALAQKKKEIDRENAIREKKIALLSAVVSTASGIARAFKDFPFPASAIIAGLVGAAGAVQIGAIASQPIPSAQFGGSFMVPPGNAADSGIVRVNQGERVDVTPVRQSGQNSGGEFVLTLNNEVFGKAVEKSLNSGRVTINRRGVVRA